MDVFTATRALARTQKEVGLLKDPLHADFAGCPLFYFDVDFLELGLIFEE